MFSLNSSLLITATSILVFSALLFYSLLYFCVVISLLFSFYNSPVWLNDQRPVVFVVVAQLQFLITCYHAKLLFLDRKTRQSDDKSKEADVRLIKAEERLRKASIEAAAYVPVIYSSICSSKI